MKLNEIIKAKRIEKGLTTRELAARVGVSQATITHWEKGEIATVKNDKLVALSEALGVEISLLIDGQSEKPLTKREKDLIENYRKLDNSMQTAVECYVSMLAATVEKKEGIA